MNNRRNKLNFLADKDVFEIKNLEQLWGIESIVLLDGNGRTIHRISLDESWINIAHLEAGLYFLRIQSGTGLSIISLVKE